MEYESGIVNKVIVLIGRHQKEKCSKVIIWTSILKLGQFILIELFSVNNKHASLTSKNWKILR